MVIVSVVDGFDLVHCRRYCFCFNLVFLLLAFACSIVTS